MRHFADWIVRPRVAWAVVLFTFLLAVVSGGLATKVDSDDDLLAFLPASDPDVAAFTDINRRFGGLEVALLGIAAPDVLDPAFFDELTRLTKALDESSQIDFALSLANVDDFVPAPRGGIETDLLVRSIPSDPDGREALRAKIRSRDLVVGQLVSPGLDAVLVMVLPSGGDPATFAREVRAVTQDVMPERVVHFGGAPFVSGYVYDATQADLTRLLPWAVGAIILFILLGFRDLVGALVVLFSTAVGIAASMALMFVFGVEHNIVLSSMPIIAFSVGSAYGLHILARYQALLRASPGVADVRHAMAGALTVVGPTVVAAGLTTVCGLFSFLAMDIRPMQTFGLFTGLGVLIALITALTFVPATIVVLGHRRTPPEASRASVLVDVVAFVHHHRRLAAAVVLVIGGAGAAFAARVDTRMDLAAFFSEDSPPARADRFMLEHFGGSQFVQVHLVGDFNDPNTLWQVTHLADRIEALPDVTSVQHIGQVIAQLDLAMEGERRIPDSTEKVKILFRLLAGRPAVGQLVLDDRREALVHAKIGKSDIDTVERVLAAVEAIASEPMDADVRSIVRSRIVVASARAGVVVDDDTVARVERELAAATSSPAADALVTHVTAFLTSDESLVELEPAMAATIAEVAVHTTGPARVLAIESLLAGKVVEGEPADLALARDLAASLDTPIAEAKRRSTAQERLQRLGDIIGAARGDPVWRSLVGGAVSLLDIDTVDPVVPVVARVSGLPVLHRGLSRSTLHNQITSLLLALFSVLVVLSIAFRSVGRGLLALVPTVFTLLFVYGGMGLLGVHLDIGTAMLASLIIGAGVDYAVHFLTAWRDEEGPGMINRVVSKTSTAIWTNALMVGAGFFILTLGEAKTLQNVGGLTAAAMLTAAAATFVCIPIFAPRAEGDSN